MDSLPYPIVVATWLFALSTSILTVTVTVPGSHVLRKRHGNHLLRYGLNASHSTKIKTLKISSGGSVGISMKFCTSKIFLLAIWWLPAQGTVDI